MLPGKKYTPEDILNILWRYKWVLLVPFVWIVRTFYVSGIWIILFWFAFDVYGALGGGGLVAYWAHVGGFVAGFALAAALLHFGWVEMRSTETSLLDMIDR